MQSPRQLMPTVLLHPLGLCNTQAALSGGTGLSKPLHSLFHITDSEHDLPNVMPLPSHCLCMLRQCYVLVQLQALELDGTGNATLRNLWQLWIWKIISKGAALLCFDSWLGKPSYQHRGMATDRKSNEGLQWCFDDDLNSKFVMVQQSESQSYTRTARS